MKNFSKIEDYALIGNCRTSALVSKDGSIDWLCLPRFDSSACFAAILGGPDFGRWQIKPSVPYTVERRYRNESLILETEFCCEKGRVRLTDAMILGDETPILVRMLDGLEGEVPMELELVLRFDYGSLVPWVRRLPGGGIDAIAGPDHVRIHTEVPLTGKNLKTFSKFSICKGQEEYFTLIWSPSNRTAMPDVAYPREVVEQTFEQWHDWSSKCTYQGPWRDAVVRSLVVLKALTYQPTGGIVAAPTTSLPESLGGVRNWDYRFCWLRDATFTLYALLSAGYRKEAEEWRTWLVRSVAGLPSQLSIMYGVRGERRLTEIELPWLPGYEGSKPVRAGNSAHAQLQLDVFGEVMDALHLARKIGLKDSKVSWELQLKLLEHLEELWREPDEGIWEVRGPRQHFVYSKVMSWVAFDRGVRGIEGSGLPGPLERWKKVRDQIYADVCKNGYDHDRGIFVQAYGSKNLDASLLLLPLVGFADPTDPRIVRTVQAIEDELMVDGFVKRYNTHETADGLPPGEAAFLACTYWLADNYVLQGRHEEAKVLFERLLSLRNDLGLLSEEWDLKLKRQMGNFPQALSHIALVNTARNLSATRGPAQDRSEKIKGAGPRGSHS